MSLIPEFGGIFLKKCLLIFFSKPVPFSGTYNEFSIAFTCFILHNLQHKIFVYPPTAPQNLQQEYFYLVNQFLNVYFPFVPYRVSFNLIAQLQGFLTVSHKTFT